MNKKNKKKDKFKKFGLDTFGFHIKVNSLFSDFLGRHSELNSKVHNEICDLRNSIDRVFDSWIGYNKIKRKFGIKIPLYHYCHFFSLKNLKIYKHRPCEICGENRVTQSCHILPNSFGGQDTKENLLYLCPNHHYLFDNYQLTEKEWRKINFKTKSTEAQEYAKKIRLPKFKNFWKTIEKINISEIKQKIEIIKKRIKINKIKYAKYSKKNNTRRIQEGKCTICGGKREDSIIYCKKCDQDFRNRIAQINGLTTHLHELEEKLRLYKVYSKNKNRLKIILRR